MMDVNEHKQRRTQSGSDSTIFTDVQHLRRVVDHIPLKVWAVALIGFWERFTFWGLTAPWQNYMENPLDSRTGVPGALGLGQAQATRIYCAFYIFYYTSPLLFAILSDTRLGRFKTLCVTTIIYVLGCAAVLATSFERPLRAGYGLPGLIVAMVLVGFGGGGLKMLMVPFLADQYPEDQPRMKTLKSGEKVVTDRSLTLQYIYNLYYWVGNVGGLSWFATTFIERYFSFALAYTLTFVSMLFAAVVLFVGVRWYIQIPPGGNILPMATRITICAARNGFSMKNADPSYQLEHHGKGVPWTGQLVDELRRGLRACVVLIPFVMFYVCFDQMQNNLISQAKQMQSNNIPNDMMPALNGIACIILGPIIQYLLYPFLNRRRIPFRPIARITTGFAFMALGMLYTTVLQHLIYSAGPCYSEPLNCPRVGDESKETSNGFMGQEGNHVNIWWQTPVYFFIATGEIFALVTCLEYAQAHAPKDMKAIVQAISLVIAGLGSAVAMALTPVARDPYLVALYASLSVAMAITTAVFWWLFHKDDKAEAIESDHGLGVDGTADNENGGFRRPLEESILRAGPRPPSQNSTVRVSMQQELDVLEPRATAASNNTADIHGTPPLPPVRALQDTIWGTLGKAT